MSLPSVIYIMGPPGAGKGTQAKLLADKLKYHQFSTGAAFRMIAREKTELGQRVHDTIHVQGKLASPELAAEIVIAAIKERVARGEGLVFDGTPRTTEEAALVDQFFLQQGYAAPFPILLRVDREEMMRRNSKRRFCLGPAQDFPVLDEADAECCAALNGVVGTRPDDEPEKFAVRWEEFQKRTLPVIERYRNEGKLGEVNGMQSIEDVQRDVMKIIDMLRD